MTEKWDRRFLDLAHLVAGWSKDPSTKVGAAIIAPNKQVVSVGFNGFPAAMGDAVEHLKDREEKYSRTIHAEVNALIFAGELPFNCTLYTWPFLPCDRCVVQLIQAGVVEFVAPKATPYAEERWGAAIERAKDYIVETMNIYKEYE